MERIYWSVSWFSVIRFWFQKSFKNMLQRNVEGFITFALSRVLSTYVIWNSVQFGLILSNSAKADSKNTHVLQYPVEPTSMQTIKTPQLKQAPQHA